MNDREDLIERDELPIHSARPEPPPVDRLQEIALPRRRPGDWSTVPWKPSDLLIGVMGLIIWRVGVGVLAAQAVDLEPITAVLLGAVVPMLLVMLFPFWAYWRATGQGAKALPNLSRIATEAVIAMPAVAALIIVTIIIGLLWQLVSDDQPQVAEGMREIAFSQNFALFLVLAVMACFWAPVAEELFFRGFLFNALGRWMPYWLAGGLQALLFALAHQYAGLHFFVIFLIGVGLTLHYAWRKTLAASMFVHAGFNSFMTAMLFVLMLTASRAPVIGIVHDPDSERLRVVGVVEGSGADEAGLQGGDVILEFGGRKVQDFAHLQERLLTRKPGEEVPIVIERDGRRRELTVELTRRPAEVNVIREVDDAA